MGEDGEGQQTTWAPKRVRAQGETVAFYDLLEKALGLKHNKYGLPQEPGLYREISIVSSQSLQAWNPVGEPWTLAFIWIDQNSSSGAENWDFLYW